MRRARRGGFALRGKPRRDLPPPLSALSALFSELLSALRKQAKLIELLKRQRAHLEAARMLDFAEKEWVEATGE